MHVLLHVCVSRSMADLQVMPTIQASLPLLMCLPPFCGDWQCFYQSLPIAQVAHLGGCICLGSVSGCSPCLPLVPCTLTAQ